jgi:hypothetical protein
MEPPMDAEFDVLAASAPPNATEYVFQLTRDWFCGEVEQNDLGCSPGTSNTTPSMVNHTKGFKALFFVTGQLSGELWVMGDINVNLRNGKGVANGTVRFSLSDPAEGGFECRVHADYVGYEPPLFAYIEYARYFNCKGSGNFEGQRMVAMLNNEANPGLPIVDGLAKIW